MSKITEYRVLESQSSYGLDVQVNEAIAKGWQPFGNLSTPAAKHAIGNSGCLRDSFNYVQAMVKYELKYE